MLKGHTITEMQMSINYILGSCDQIMELLTCNEKSTCVRSEILSEKSSAYQRQLN